MFADFKAAWAVASMARKISGLNGDSNPDPYDAGAVLHQLTYQANIQA